ncbi:phosphoribosyltransferase [Nitrosococcus wardiae]|uniref:Phosphoribosyltransferase n=1 Tax=Nitrosococcus wardiae TaxID=1814290 RepID=A0A4P7BVN2_9GAMM|nr:phosphoribosyltransferase [Nitrosococcus wardiae]QBQ53140.1 phosphoribosyltransferase [Nitrosococcus wardiae]
MQLPFKNRVEAGRLLADALKPYAGRTDVLILALPRGGLPVAFEVAQVLAAPLDLMLVRKLGVPGQEELAMGAIASGGITYLNQDLAESLRISDSAIDGVASREKKELERREQAYRGHRPIPEVRNRCVILIDDGLATGATMRAAVLALRQRQPGRIVIGVPVAPADTVENLRAEADEVICLATPEPFLAIGKWYEDFSQTSDEEVRDLLTRAWQQRKQE